MPLPGRRTFQYVKGKGKGKGKGLDTCYSATYMSQTRGALQSRKWQLIGMSQWCRSALCGHPLPALTATVQLADTPSPQSPTLGLHSVAVATTHFPSR